MSTFEVQKATIAEQRAILTHSLTPSLTPSLTRTSEPQQHIEQSCCIALEPKRAKIKKICYPCSHMTRRYGLHDEQEWIRWARVSAASSKALRNMLKPGKHTTFYVYSHYPCSTCSTKRPAYKYIQQSQPHTKISVQMEHMACQRLLSGYVSSKRGWERMGGSPVRVSRTLIQPISKLWGEYLQLILLLENGFTVQNGGERG